MLFQYHTPGTNSITIMMGCFCTQIPMSFTMFGWSYCFSMRPSCRNFFLCSSGSVMRHVFTATSFLLVLRCALYTSPKFPCIQTTRAVLSLYYALNYKSINLYCLAKFMSIISKNKGSELKRFFWKDLGTVGITLKLVAAIL